MRGQKGPLTITVWPSHLCIDEKWSVQILGLEPGQHVTVRARMPDDQGRAWESYAVFAANGDSVVDLTTQAPLSGTYAGVDPMGLVWSMRLAGSADERSFFSWRHWHPVKILLAAGVASEAIATIEVERHLVASNVIKTAVSEDSLVGTLYRPAGGGLYPSVVLLGGSGGDTPESVAALVASHGYAALALGYFGRGNLPEQLTSIPLEYFQRAFGWLRSQEEIKNQGLAVMGWSRGGELALLLGATFPEVTAVVSYVGSGVIHAGFVASPLEAENPPAWAYQGKSLLPSISFAPNDVDQSQSPIRQTSGFLRALAEAERIEAATIPVERIKGSVLLISGRDDQVWPSAPMSDIAIQRLAKHQHPFRYEHLCYAGAGHGIFQPYWPTTVHQYQHSVDGRSYAIGGNAQDDAVACADSWQKVLAFLAESLKAD